MFKEFKFSTERTSIDRRCIANTVFLNENNDGVEHLFLQLPHFNISVSVMYINAFPYVIHSNLVIIIFEKYSDHKFLFVGD